MTEPDIKKDEIEIFSQHIPNMNYQENRPFLTIKEVSELLRISVSTINRLIKNRDFPQKIKLSPGRTVFMKNDIEEWITRKRNN